MSGIKGIKIRKILLSMLVSFFVASILLAHVWKQNTYMYLAKAVGKDEREQSKLRGEIARIEMEINELKRGDRIENLARERFGLSYGSAPILVYAEKDETQKPVEKLAKWTGFKNVFTGSEADGNREWEAKGL